MPTISRDEAIERLAVAVEHASSDDLSEVLYELFPSRIPSSSVVSARDLAALIRSGLEGEVVVDLWNVIFPTSRRVAYNEDCDSLDFEERNPLYVGI